jgi:hypothetical protein
MTRRMTGARMGRMALWQAFYTVPGILFFVRDLFANVPMDKAMIGAFIWPYAQWGLMRDTALRLLDPVLKLIQ